MKKRSAVLLVIAVVFALSPAGWKLGGKNDANAGWSWNPEIASVEGDVVTLVDKRGSSLTLTAIEGSDPIVGDDATIVESAVIWQADDGGTIEQPLGWTWNG